MYILINWFLWVGSASSAVITFLDNISLLDSCRISSSVYPTLNAGTANSDIDHWQLYFVSVPILVDFVKGLADRSRTMFTPAESAIGAILVHCATTSFLFETGKTIGFSSTIYNAAFQPSMYASSIAIGMIAASIFVLRYLPSFVPQYPTLPVTESALAGLLTGAGTALGSGCTSGHMLAGVSLLRKRSIIATIVFCTVAAFVVNCLDLAPACNGPCYHYDPTFRAFSENKRELLGLLLFGYVTSFVLLPQLGTHAYVRALSGLNAGFQFGLGLLISGMASPAKPLGFLSVYHFSKFDPSLVMIVLFAILPNIYKWRRFISSHPRPILEPAYALPTATQVTGKMLIGNSLFGMGWGLVGTCPGPGLIGAVLNGRAGVLWLGSFLVAYKAGLYLR